MKSMHIEEVAWLVPFTSPAAAVQYVRHRSVMANAPESPTVGHRDGSTSFVKKVTNRCCNQEDTSAQSWDEGFETGTGSRDRSISHHLVSVVTDLENDSQFMFAPRI